MKTRALSPQAAAVFAALALRSSIAYAHERFVKHKLKVPLQNDFFLRHPGAPLGMHPSMLRVGVNAIVVLAVFTVAWFVRQPMQELVERRVLRRVGGVAQRIMHQVACFLTDRPVRVAAYRTLGEW